MKNILIIGAGPGISRATAERFGKENFRVQLIARNEYNLENERKRLEKQGIECCYVVGDASDFGSLKQAIDQLLHLFGVPDIVLYNASGYIAGDQFELTWDQIRSMIDINAGGAYNTAQIIMPHYEKKKRGNLFFTGGCLSMDGDPEWLSLCMGKAAMRNFVQALAKKYENTQIRISQVTICGIVTSNSKKNSPAIIADVYWNLWSSEDIFANEIIH
ncbi:MAG: SDR family NAD(P)-dependent oxidoreductase [Bacteroidales bacterium]